MSKVYHAMQVMAPNRKIFALKRIRLQGRDREAASGFIDEITLLQRLRGQRNIIQLLDSEVGQIIVLLDNQLVSLLETINVRERNLTPSAAIGSTIFEAKETREKHAIWGVSKVLIGTLPP